MKANRDERMTLHSFITIHRHNAAVAAEQRALDMEDGGPCTANDHAFALRQLDQLRLAASLALQAESMERGLAA